MTDSAVFFNFLFYFFYFLFSPAARLTEMNQAGSSEPCGTEQSEAEEGAAPVLGQEDGQQLPHGKPSRFP